MKKRLFSLVVIATMMFSFVACGQKEEAPAQEVVEETVEETVESSLGLEDGEYVVDFTTDSGMFHVNETLDNKGTLTVKDGQGTVHITLGSKNIVNLYLGLAADAETDEANWLQPTTDEVTYEDGTTEEVYGFDVPVSVIGEEFDLALLGTKGTWYDHKVMVANPTAK